VLEAASVAGVEFSAAAVAAGVAIPVEEVEQRGAALARRGQFLRVSGTAGWPDGTVAARYTFLHALYQEVIYDRVTATQRRAQHLRVGEREEAAYGERAGEIAAELAVHFEQGRDYRRAVQYCRQAGENAIRRSASQEAIRLLTKGLELLQTLPDTPGRIQQELDIQVALCLALMVHKGEAATEVKHAYNRALDLCQQVGEAPRLFPVLWGLWAAVLVSAEFQRAHELGEQLLRLGYY
jgi:predicted ATPase